MHPRNNDRINDAVKQYEYNYGNSILDALNRTGYDLDDVSALTCISKIRLLNICNREEPTEHELSLLKMVFNNL